MMKIKQSIFLVAIISLTLASCRKEETEFIQAPEEETLNPNSNVALLMQRTASNDGSNDNIVDRANCFSIAFPYTINVNSQQLYINSQSDFEIIECVFSDDDVNEVEINFPITIILSDFSEVSIANTTELNNYINSCNGENEADDDIECIDFEYPIEASIFNANNQLLDTVYLQSDSQLYSFIDDIDEDDIVILEFPITVYLANGSEVTINNLNELETAIENADNTCDEDDDYDYEDDDCDNCTLAMVEELLLNCSDWEVDKLERNNNDYDNLYDGYEFNFFSNGTMSVYWSGITADGTWVASGSGNDIEIIVNVPDLPLCNNNWILHEVENCSDETKIDLRVADADRLRYVNNCN